MPYKMKDGRWRAERMIGGVRRTHVCATKEQAKKWEANQDGKGWTEPGEQTPTAYLWASVYLDFAQERFAAKTYYHKRAAFVRLLQAIKPSTPAEDITTQDAFRCLLARSRESSGYAANTDRKNLRAAWTWAQKHIPHFPQGANPFSAVDRFPETHTPRYVPPEADFWQAVRVGCTRDDDRRFLLFMLYTSARLNEVCALTWGRVDLARSRVSIGTRKRTGGGMEYDWVPLVHPAQEILAAMPQSEGLVFPGPDGEAYTARQHIMRKICKRAGVKHFGFHAIRHLSAAILARERVPVPVIQGILRHKNATTTSVYLRSLGADLPELDRVWRGRNEGILHTPSTHENENSAENKVIQ